MTTHCCEAMNHRADVRCDEHDDPVVDPARERVCRLPKRRSRGRSAVTKRGGCAVTVDRNAWDTPVAVIG
ncbi:hypothetical protein [Streptomyces sp. ACT015]|uniref:hypothetical protein n=1 Tax=Streptomyces sp. ACT015 TaxID=3134807 RepID=UPI003D17E059